MSHISHVTSTKRATVNEFNGSEQEYGGSFDCQGPAHIVRTIGWGDGYVKNFSLLNCMGVMLCLHSHQGYLSRLLRNCEQDEVRTNVDNCTPMRELRDRYNSRKSRDSRELVQFHSSTFLSKLQTAIYIQELNENVITLLSITRWNIRDIRISFHSGLIYQHISKHLKMRQEQVENVTDKINVPFTISFLSLLVLSGWECKPCIRNATNVCSQQRKYLLSNCCSLIAVYASTLVPCSFNWKLNKLNVQFDRTSLDRICSISGASCHYFWTNLRINPFWFLLFFFCDVASKTCLGRRYTAISAANSTTIPSVGRFKSISSTFVGVLKIQICYKRICPVFWQCWRIQCTTSADLVK